ncbi:hypothetical protein A2U01_0024054 [Trifolium medium]|uniref:Uncharacterized protein n=1 Tax=Trifolium medium TaxID=97028 RepID=A0A392NUY2_9FABA|nr:hypothetical protein [Trifolium medium]
MASPPITTATAATTTTVNIGTLDSTIIKSLFAVAVFLSLALNPNPIPFDTLASASDQACYPTVNMVRDLVFSQFYALSTFIFSAITSFSLRNIKGSLLGIPRTIRLMSDIGFIVGVIYLLSAIVSLAEMKFGKISCGSSVTLTAVAPLLILAPFSLLIFMGSSIVAYMAG